MPNYWDRFVNTYTSIGDAEFWLKHRMRLMQGLSGRILEVCCGGGRLVLEMLKANLDAYGIDLSQKMVAAAKKKLLESDFPTDRILQADVTRLPFPDGDFDVIISTGAIGLFNTKSQSEAVKEIVRVARHEIRLLEPFEKKKGLYGGRILAFLFDGMRPIQASTFQASPIDVQTEWDIFGGAFSYIHGIKR